MDNIFHCLIQNKQTLYQKTLNLCENLINNQYNNETHTNQMKGITKIRRLLWSMGEYLFFIHPIHTQKACVYAAQEIAKLRKFWTRAQSATLSSASAGRKADIEPNSRSVVTRHMSVIGSAFCALLVFNIGRLLGEMLVLQCSRYHMHLLYSCHALASDPAPLVVRHLTIL